MESGISRLKRESDSIYGASSIISKGTPLTKAFQRMDMIQGYQ